MEKDSNRGRKSSQQNARNRPVVRGRGSSDNQVGRFETIQIESLEPKPERVETSFLRDSSKSILATNDSPDVPFSVSINPYRGCEHGCVYCYARPTHEFLGFSAGLDFESKILIKEDAAELLEKELSSDRWKPQVIGMSGVTDPYQPVERKLEITRACLEVLERFRNPVVIVTKNALVRRDVDLLVSLARYNAAAVLVSVTTLDPNLARIMEPRTSHPRDRLATVRQFAEAGVSTGVLLAPVVPAITDHEIPEILEAAAEAGAERAGFIPLRLPGAVLPLFETWLEEQFPDRKEKVLSRIRELRGGKLNDSRFGHRMGGQGVFYQQMRALFEGSCRRVGIGPRKLDLSASSFRRPGGSQLDLFT